MDIGKKILELRKKNHLSQEQLAEKTNVTRQTISNWELGETSPDLKQAKELSKIFKVSLDELVDNDIKNIIEEKVSNTEKLAGIIIKLLKYLGIAFLVMLVIDIVFFIFFTVAKMRAEDIGTYQNRDTITCVLDGEEYFYEIVYNDQFQVIAEGGDDFIHNHVLPELYDNPKVVEAQIEDYFIERNGSCKINTNGQSSE